MDGIKCCREIQHNQYSFAPLIQDGPNLLRGFQERRQWWLRDCVCTSCRPLHFPHTELMVVTDESRLDWGGQMGDVRSVEALQHPR